ncbi:MAG: hypothetical protein AAGG50_15400 [Bacteroidota bacterium]
MRLLLLSSALFLLAACTEPASESTADTPTAPAVEMPALATAADSVAMQAYAYAGGPEAWASVEALRFDFAFERDGERVPIRHHLWDRTSGAYRIDWSNGDTLYTALFNANQLDVDGPDAGTVYRDGEVLPDPEHAEALEGAHRAYLNDTYWLLLPIKLFDPGVTRGLDADSSDAETAVLTLAFDGVGLTPGDTYHVYVDRATGAVARWAFVLESGGSAAYDWVDYQTFDTAAGPIRLSARKANDQGRVLLTDALALPTDLEPTVFTDPAQRLSAPAIDA